MSVVNLVLNAEISAGLSLLARGAIALAQSASWSKKRSISLKTLALAASLTLKGDALSSLTFLRRAMSASARCPPGRRALLAAAGEANATRTAAAATEESRLEPV